MAAIDLRKAQRTETGELIGGWGSSASASQNHSSAETSRPLPSFPEHIQKRIYDVVCSADGWVSRADIAKSLGLKKTPWLVAHLEMLVGTGYLHRDQAIRPSGMVMYFYEAIK